VSDSEILVCPMQARLQVGGCNACTDRDYQFVTDIRLRGLSFRLCARCLRKLRVLIDPKVMSRQKLEAPDA
jgi:hypothetical protein